jgi:hypothetical protein
VEILAVELQSVDPVNRDLVGVKAEIARIESGVRKRNPDVILQREALPFFMTLEEEHQWRVLNFTAEQIQIFR